MFTLSTLVGLSVAQLTQGTIVGNLGFGEVAFPKPLFHGDTLYAETEVTDKRESKSRPGEGIVTSDRDGNLRVSAHAYNTAEDVDRVLGALTAHRELLA